MKDNIDSFIKKLSKERSGDDFENLYYGESITAQIRRHNLRTYLELMYQIKPETILIGEAPGYGGCKLTGIPFTSERILNDILFFKNENFKFVHSIKHLLSEKTATIFWEELEKYKNKPLIWNIYPYHPHPVNKANKNRTPTREELDFGGQFSKELLKIYQINKVGAIGRKSEKTLNRFGIASQYIRHPSYGGKKDFMTGIKTFLTT